MKINRKKFLLMLNRIVFFFEIFISMALLIGILISIPDIVKYYLEIFRNNAQISSGIFKDFLSHVLLLVIAMEFVLLMVAHTDSTIIHLILLVISRKMLIESEQVFDLLIGVIAIAILFAIRKYLLVDASDTRVSLTKHKGVFSTEAKIEDINGIYGFEIEDNGYEKLGELVLYLFNEESTPLSKGEIVSDDLYFYEIKTVSNGIVKTVLVYNVK